MRVALIGFKNIEKKDLFCNMSLNISNLIYLDFFEDSEVEEAEYCIDIRSYDLVLINYFYEHKKQYINIFGSIDRKYKTNKVLFFEQSLNSNLGNFLFEYKKIYKNINTEIISPFYEREALIQFLSNSIYNTFILTPNIQNISIDYENKTVNVVINNTIIPIKIKRTIDYQVLMYFVRHYGEVINLDCVLSAITEEPEYIELAIETSISNIRKIFKSCLKKNPIKSFKKIGYRFQI